MPGDFDLCGALRRIRRIADLSQREMAAAAGLSVSAVAHAEAGTRDLPVAALQRAATLAGLRLALLDATGIEIEGMADGAVRDMSGRRFPAHLDTRYGDEAWWHGPERYSRVQPWYTFDRERTVRDWYRRRDGTSHDHQLPQPGDSPQERTAARRAKAWKRRLEEVRRLRLEGRLPERVEFTCTCPPRCEELDDRSGKPVHAPECPCDCDVA